MRWTLIALSPLVSFGVLPVAAQDYSKGLDSDLQRLIHRRGGLPRGL